MEEKLERQDACKAVEEQVIEQYADLPQVRENAQRAFDALEKTLIRGVAVQKKRPDDTPPTRMVPTASRSA